MLQNCYYHQGVKRTQENPIMVLNDIQGIKNILQLSKNSSVKRVFFSSSSEVYGEQKKFPINENSELKNKSIYATSKIVAEQYVRGFYQKFKLKFNIIRFFNVYGPNEYHKSRMASVVYHTFTNKQLFFIV